MEIKIRTAAKKDLLQIIKLLSQLTTVGNPSINDISESIFNNILVAYTTDPIEPSDPIETIDTSETIVGIATLFIERKIIHNASAVGHIEDVVVDENYRNNGIGKILIDACIEKARKIDCYKVILDCSESYVKFYQKCGFYPAGICMRLDV